MAVPITRIVKGIYRGVRREIKNYNIELEYARVEKRLISRLGGTEVISGPFKGLIYPEAESVCSTLAPKLLGTYERELHPWLDKFSQRSFDKVIDIGCAEGYYAAGLAKMFEDVQVYAYDIDRNARRLTRAIGKVNGISSDQLIIGGECSQSDLINKCEDRRTLVLCDIEGCERELFDESVVPALSRSDLIIETHDCFNIEISATLRSIFKNSHIVHSVLAIDDIQKPHLYSVDLLNDFTLSERYLLLAEKRGYCQEWLVLESICDGNE